MKKVKRHHKWFRNERYKQKLERNVDKHKTYYSNVFFITKEPDPKYIREGASNFCASWWTNEEKLKYLTQKAHGKEYYVYHDRPEIDYSIQHYHKSPKRSRRQVDLKKRTSRRVRQAFREKGEIYRYNSYRKTTEFWWELD